MVVAGNPNVNVKVRVCEARPYCERLQLVILAVVDIGDNPPLYSSLPSLVSIATAPRLGAIDKLYTYHSHYTYTR